MKWKAFFKPVGSIDSGEARTYMAAHQEGTYTLLDVRQPGEYEEIRIPGATLIPLPQLSDRLGELDTGKPVLTYCAIGGRSRAAAQLLAGQGFKEVYNLKGGIKAWNGLKAEGPIDFDNDFSAVKDMSPHEVVGFALVMEKGLANFYLLAARESGDKDVGDLLRKLAGFEEKHRQKLQELYQILNPGGVTDEKESTPTVMEGGGAPDDFFKKNQSRMKTTSDVLSLSMMLETQALDLYLRLAGYVEEKESRAVLLGIANDEKAHLSALGEMIDRREA